jgi:cell division protein FtsL
VPLEREEMSLKFKKAGIFTKIIIAFLVVYAVISLASLRTRIAAARDEQQTLREQIAQQEAENAELEYAVKNSGNQDVIEDVARDELNMIYPDEKVYYAN